MKTKKWNNKTSLLFISASSIVLWAVILTIILLLTGCTNENKQIAFSLLGAALSRPRAPVPQVDLNQSFRDVQQMQMMQMMQQQQQMNNYQQTIRNAQ
jgi:hypothetical protein